MIVWREWKKERKIMTLVAGECTSMQLATIFGACKSLTQLQQRQKSAVNFAPFTISLDIYWFWYIWSHYIRYILWS